MSKESSEDINMTASTGKKDPKKASSKSTGTRKLSASKRDGTLKKEPTIEECLAKLDKILEKMEDEDTGLEESFHLYEEGLGIVKKVNGSIDKVEKKITVLSDGEEAAYTKDEDVIDRDF